MHEDPLHHPARRAALTQAQRTALERARRAVLATIAPDGRPRLVPICFVLDPRAPVIYSPLDEKPKRVANPHELARARDVGRDPRATVLVDSWDEDWSQLEWTRCEGLASILEPSGAAGDGEHATAVAALRAKYPQYSTHDLDRRPLIRFALDRVTGWAASGRRPDPG